MKRLTPNQLGRELEELRLCDAKAMRLKWREVMGNDPPAKLQSSLLRLAIAYRLQERVHGGLKAETARRLNKVGKSIAAEKSSASRVPRTAFNPATSLTPGTRLMREWNGTTHLVEVVDGGFAWRGSVYKTLSSTAVAITGTKWSGPRFFGLMPEQIRKARGVTRPSGSAQRRVA